MINYKWSHITFWTQPNIPEEQFLATKPKILLLLTKRVCFFCSKWKRWTAKDFTFLWTSLVKSSVPCKHWLLVSFLFLKTKGWRYQRDGTKLKLSWTVFAFDGLKHELQCKKRLLLHGWTTRRLSKMVAVCVSVGDWPTPTLIDVAFPTSPSHLHIHMFLHHHEASEVQLLLAAKNHTIALAWLSN